MSTENETVTRQPTTRIARIGKSLRIDNDEFKTFVVCMLLGIYGINAFATGFVLLEFGWVNRLDAAVMALSGVSGQLVMIVILLFDLVFPKIKGVFDVDG